METASIFGISRHRMRTDGDGVTTLVTFTGCPLRCKYCLNPQCFKPEDSFPCYTPSELYDIVKKDNLYFLATGGGITFGGGEPALRGAFIREFRQLCGREWHLCMETSLNVPGDFLPPLVKDLDFFIVDIKDMDPEIYRAYTGKDNAKVLENLRMIATAGRADDCTIRIPLIPGYNTDEDRDRSIAALKELGFSKFDKFTYRYGKR